MRALTLCPVVCLVGLSLPFVRCTKLPSWRGPNTIFEGTLPSNRSQHGFTADDDGKLYVFGGSFWSGDSDGTSVSDFCNNFNF